MGCNTLQVQPGCCDGETPLPPEPSGGYSGAPPSPKECSGCDGGFMPLNGFTLNVSGVVDALGSNIDCSTWNSLWVADLQECPNECILTSPRVLVPGLFGIDYDLWVRLSVGTSGADTIYSAAFLYAVHSPTSSQLCSDFCGATGVGGFIFRYTQTGSHDCTTPSAAAMTMAVSPAGCGFCDFSAATITITANP